MSSSLLINEHPLQVLPTLAVAVGLNEAIILQQVHYWITNKDKRSKPYERDGRHWVYNTYEEWREQFPFWSVRTIQRHALTLEEKGLLVVEQFDLKAGDARKYYTLDYDKLNELTGDPSRQVGTTPSDKVAPPHDDKLALPSRQVGTTIVPTWHYLIGTETSSETNTESREEAAPLPIDPALKNIEELERIVTKAQGASYVDSFLDGQLKACAGKLHAAGFSPDRVKAFLATRRKCPSLNYFVGDIQKWESEQSASAGNVIQLARPEIPSNATSWERKQILEKFNREHAQRFASA